MMHLKNIKAGNAKTLEQYELTKMRIFMKGDHSITSIEIG